MLVEGVRGSLNTVTDTRHDMQNLMVKLAEEVLENKATFLKDAVSLAQEVVHELESGTTGVVARLAAVEEALAAKMTVLSERATANACAKDQLRDARSALTSTEEAQRTKDAGFQELKDDKVNVEAAIALEVSAIAAGESQGENVVALCKKFSFDDALTLALPKTCARAVADRGAFDKMVLDQLDAALKEKLVDLTKAIEAELPAGEARTKAVHQAKDAVERAVADQAETAAKESAAQAACSEAKAEVDSAKTALADREPAVQRANALLDEKAESLEMFQSAVWNPFVALRDARAQDETPKIVETDGIAAPEVVAVSVGGA